MCVSGGAVACMKAADALTALNYRADYSSRMAAGLFLWLTFTMTKCACINCTTLNYTLSHIKAQSAWRQRGLIYSEINMKILTVLELKSGLRVTVMAFQAHFWDFRLDTLSALMS